MTGFYMKGNAGMKWIEFKLSVNCQFWIARIAKKMVV